MYSSLTLVLLVNANQVHAWSHTPRYGRPCLVVLLQDFGVLQSSKQHANHHKHDKDTNYCVLTNFVNPILDGLGFWRALEWFLMKCGAKMRPDLSV
jgi:Lipid desaturase domain